MVKPQREARRRSPPAVEGPPPPAFPDAVAVLVFAAIAATVLLHVVAPTLPGAWLWGLDVARTSSVGWRYVPWALAALVLVPAVGRPIARGLDRVLRTPGLVTALVVCAGLTWVVWTIPDRLQFVGDAVMRLGTIGAQESAERLFPQAFPLDLWLHVTLPREMVASMPLSAIGAARMLGSIEAIVFGACAVAFARAIGAKGAIAAGVIGVVAAGGALALFTGYLKAFVELCVLTAMLGALAVRVVADGRGRAAFGLALAVALLLHRSAFALLPGAAVVAVLDSRRHPGAWRRPATLIGAGATLVAILVDLPQLRAVLGSFDMARHIVPADVRAHGGPLAAAFAPGHLLDLANLLLLLVPLAPVAPALLAARAPGGAPSEGWSGVRLALVGLASGPLALALIVRPQQGLFRDWDVFAMTGVALSLVLAALLRDALSAARGRAWLAVPALVVTCGATLQHMALQNRTKPGLERVAHVLTGPPARSAEERSRGWDYVGTVALTDGDAELAVRAFRSSIEAAPNPRLYVQWGLAEATRGDDAKAIQLYSKAVELSPGLFAGWKGLAVSASRVGDWNELARAAANLREMSPNDPATLEAIRAWEQRRPAEISLYQ